MRVKVRSSCTKYCDFKRKERAYLMAGARRSDNVFLWIQPHFPLRCLPLASELPKVSGHALCTHILIYRNTECSSLLYLLLHQDQTFLLNSPWNLPPLHPFFLSGSLSALALVQRGRGGSVSLGLCELVSAWCNYDGWSNFQRRLSPRGLSPPCFLSALMTF